MIHAPHTHPFKYGWHRRLSHAVSDRHRRTTRGVLSLSRPRRPDPALRARALVELLETYGQMITVSLLLVCGQVIKNIDFHPQMGMISRTLRQGLVEVRSVVVVVARRATSGVRSGVPPSTATSNCCRCGRGRELVFFMVLFMIVVAIFAFLGVLLYGAQAVMPSRMNRGGGVAPQKECLPSQRYTPQQPTAIVALAIIARHVQADAFATIDRAVIACNEMILGTYMPMEVWR